MSRLRSSSTKACAPLGVAESSVARYIEELGRQHATDHATYYGTMIWVIMMLERWLQAKDL